MGGPPSGPIRPGEAPPSADMLTVRLPGSRSHGRSARPPRRQHRDRQLLWPSFQPWLRGIHGRWRYTSAAWRLASPLTQYARSPVSSARQTPLQRPQRDRHSPGPAVQQDTSFRAKGLAWPLLELIRQEQRRLVLNLEPCLRRGSGLQSASAPDRCACEQDDEQQADRRTPGERLGMRWRRPSERRLIPPGRRVGVGTGHLSAQHGDLLAQHEQLEILDAIVAGELGQHLRQAPHYLHQAGARRVPNTRDAEPASCRTRWASAAETVA